MRKSKKAYEEYMNGIYPPGTMTNLFAYLWHDRTSSAFKLIYDGKYGTAIRRYDPIAFEVGYREWQP